jgi:hypothetical protein
MARIWEDLRISGIKTSLGEGNFALLCFQQHMLRVSLRCESRKISLYNFSFPVQKAALNP